MPQLEPYWELPYLYNRSTRAAFEYVGKKHISDKLVFLHENWLNLYEHNKDYSLLANRIRIAAKNSQRFPILCLAWNYFHADRIKLQLDQELGNKNYFIILTDPKHDTDCNTSVWPQCLVSMHSLPNYQINCVKNYRISYLAGGVRYHRLSLWEKIKDLATDKDIVVANRFGTENYKNSVNYQKISPEIAMQAADCWFKQLPWSNRPGLIDNQDQTVLHSVNQWDNDHVAYNAMINITG